MTMPGDQAKPDREGAAAILREYTQNPQLIKHALAVEAAMRHYARIFGEDQEWWGLIGLLHDFDYERWPNLPDHPLRGEEILRQRGYPEDVIRAIKSHAGDTLGIARERLVEKVLYAVDELTGMVVAVALVRPTRSIYEVDVAAVKKKMKDKSFARGVNREDVYRGARELDVDLDKHIATVIEALKEVAAALEIEGKAQA